MASSGSSARGGGRAGHGGRGRGRGEASGIVLDLFRSGFETYGVRQELLAMGFAKARVSQLLKAHGEALERSAGSLPPSSGGSRDAKKGGQKRRLSNSDSEESDEKTKTEQKDKKKPEKLSKDKSHRDGSVGSVPSEVLGCKEDEEPAYLLVAHSAAQELHSKLLNLKENIGSNSDGRFPTEDIVILIQSIPGQVLKKKPALQRYLEKLRTEDEVSNAVARTAVLRLMRLVEEIEWLHESQQEINVGSSSASKESEKKDD